MIIVYGFLLGSFLAVMALRSIRCISVYERHPLMTHSSQMRMYRAVWFYVLTGRSRCDACGHCIKPYENIPIFSYLFLGFKCSSCSTPIPIRLWLCEVFVFSVSVLLYFMYADYKAQIFLLLLFAILLVIAWIDYEKKVIPDLLSYFVFWLGIGAHWFLERSSLADQLMTAVLAYAMLKFLQQYYLLVRRRYALGDADPLLAFAICAWLPLDALPYFFMGATLATLLLMVRFVRKDASLWETQIPFGPGLAISGFVCVAYYMR